MLGTRYRPGVVFIGVAAAFAVHVIIAVAAGGVLGLAPRPVVEATVAVLFLAGAVMMLLRERRKDEESAGRSRSLEPAPAPPGRDRGTVAVLSRTRTQPSTRTTGFWAVASTSFGVLFVAEFGDLTQIAIANMAAKYHDLVAVAIGATLGLWAVGGLAVLGGRQLLRWIPLTWITRAAALVMMTLGVISAVHAVTG